MRANPVFMIGADRCAEGPFGDWYLVPVATDWQIGDGLADWGWIGELVMDWLIGTEFALDRQIGDGLADLPRNGIGLVEAY